MMRYDDSLPCEPDNLVFLDIICMLCNVIVSTIIFYLFTNKIDNQKIIHDRNIIIIMLAMSVIGIIWLSCVTKVQKCDSNKNKPLKHIVKNSILISTPEVGIFVMCSFALFIIFPISIILNGCCMICDKCHSYIKKIKSTKVKTKTNDNNSKYIELKKIENNDIL